MTSRRTTARTRSGSRASPPSVPSSSTAATEFRQATATVGVSDGRLTVDAIGGTNTKLNYLEISRVTVSAPAGLTATGGDAQVALAWTADASAAGYRVYRGGTLIASPAATRLPGHRGHQRHRVRICGLRGRPERHRVGPYGRGHRHPGRLRAEGQLLRRGYRAPDRVRPRLRGRLRRRPRVRLGPAQRRHRGQPGGQRPQPEPGRRAARRPPGHVHARPASGRVGRGHHAGRVGGSRPGRALHGHRRSRRRRRRGGQRALGERREPERDRGVRPDLHRPARHVHPHRPGHRRPAHAEPGRRYEHQVRLHRRRQRPGLRCDPRRADQHPGQRRHRCAADLKRGRGSGAAQRWCRAGLADFLDGDVDEAQRRRGRCPRTRSPAAAATW